MRDSAAWRLRTLVVLRRSFVGGSVVSGMLRREHFACLFLAFAMGGFSCASLWAQPAGTPLTVSGALVDERGAAAAGVEVLLRPYPTAFELDLDLLGYEALPEIVGAARSAADGSYSLSAPVPGPYRLEFRPAPPADPPGVAMPLVFGRLTPLDTPRFLVESELPDRRRVAVRVVDADDRPIEGLLVVATPTAERSARYRPAASNESPQLLHPRLHRSAARTDAEGAARFLMPTAEAGVSVSGPGFLSVQAKTQSGRASFRLVRDPGIRFRVRGPDGAPAAGVLIRSQGEPGMPLAVTDENGEALASPFGDAETTFEFERADYAFAQTKTRRPRDLSASERVVDVRLEEPLVLYGRVVDAESGTPLDGATVMVARSPGYATSSDRAGTFELNARPTRADVYLWASARGYASAEPSTEAPAHGGPVELSIGLNPAAPLFGVVSDSAGEPVAGAAIWAERQGHGAGADRSYYRPLRAVSGTDGAFSLADALYGSPYRLTVRAPGFPSAMVDVPPLERGAVAEPIRIVLSEARRARGRVMDTEGRPVPGAEVRLRWPPENERPSHLLDRLDATEAATTNDAGEFRFPAVSEGEYEVRIAHAEYLTPGDARAAVLGGQGDVDLGVFTVVRGAEIHGLVTGPDDEAVAGADVRVDDFRVEREQRRSTTTDLDGTFRLAGLPHGQVDLNVSAEGFAPSSFRGARTGSDEPILIELQAGATLAVRVVDDAGKPVAGASLELEPDTPTLMRMGVWSSGDFFKRTGSDGSFRFENVGAGTWSIEATEGNAKAELDGIELVAGTERFVELQLRARDRLTVVVTARSGEPVADAEILVMSEESLYSNDYGTTDVNGRARIGVTPGAVTVHTSHDEYQDDSREVVLEPGSNELAVQLRAGGTIAGAVRSADGTPLVAATVEAHPEDELDGPARYRGRGDAAKTMSDRQGRFRIVGLEPGTWFVVGRAPGFAADGPEQPFDIDGQGVEGVDIVLEPGGSIVGTVTGLGVEELSQVKIEASRQAAWQTTAPDTEGNFALKDMAAGEWKVVARKGDIFASRTVERTVTLGAGPSESFVELPFERGLRLSGRVFLAGDPLMGEALGAVSPNDGEPRWTETDHRGRFEMSGLEPGAYDLTIQMLSGRAEQRSIDLRADLEGLRIDLEPPASATGVVLDATTGQPLAYAWLTAGATQQIAALRSDDGDHLYTAETMSETGGRFEIEFGAGVEQLWVEREGYEDVLVPLNVPPGQRREGLVVRMQPAASEAPEQ